MPTTRIRLGGPALALRGYTPVYAVLRIEPAREVVKQLLRTLVPLASRSECTHCNACPIILSSSERKTE